ncbi:MAG: hypothetical protein QOJ35_1865 [Solirubrobacteraceae bacterium]|nr:hypothetical protein [Solirubrobacteraceae bacterium]
MTSKAGYWIGAGLVVLGVGGAILWAVLSFAHIVSTIDDFQRVEIPGAGKVRLEARKYIVYVEGPGADQHVPAVRVQITDERTELPLPLSSYGGSLTYSFDQTGSAQATVTAPRAGSYRVLAAGTAPGGGYAIALGESVGGKIVGAILGALLVGAVLGGSGIALLIVTGVRRSRSRRRAPPPDGWPPPAPA